MLKFIRGKGQQPSAERQRLQKELFHIKKQHNMDFHINLLPWHTIQYHD
ncbi:hypothetical protein DOY81_000013 [Sarcophaga bullata]|nr:hypothetical protein DOY81_000013 [Sarcophaga bullata]